MKPNHICKYSKCDLGEDGGRKHYYACNYCDRTNAWRSAACCKEHYDLYVQEVLEARSKNKVVNILPERTDKSQEEIQNLYEKSETAVLEETKQELKEYLNNGETIAEAIEVINTEIDNSNKKSRRRKKS